MSRTQYILIERTENHPTAVRRDVLDDMIKSGVIILKSRPVTKAEIKRERIHVEDVDTYFRLKAFGAFKQRFDGMIFKAKVLWFDPSSGEGMVEGLNREGHWLLYACNIPGRKTWYPETACVTHTPDQVIDVEVKVSYGGSILVSHSPGTPDSAKWDRLKEQNLAFRCDETGKAVNGLFA